MFHDLDGDGISNMIFGTDSGELFAYDSNLVLLDNFPINYRRLFQVRPNI